MAKTVKTILLLALMAIAAGCTGSDGEGQQEQTAYQGIDTVPMLITQIKKCSRLYTTEMKVHKIVTHDDVVKLQGKLLKQNIDIKLPMGERKVAIPIDATLKAYIDFSDFSERNIERTADGKITILLPDPRVELTSSKVNQQEIRSFVGIVRSRFSDGELTRYEQQGREAIIQSIPRLGIVDMAKASAAHALVPIIRQMGYREEDITVAYRKDFKSFDISRFIEVRSGK